METSELKFSYIRKLADGKFQVLSGRGKSLGIYNSEAKAVHHLKQIDKIKSFKRSKTASVKDIDLTDIHDYSYSAIVRALRQIDSGICNTFLKTFKKIFDEQMQVKGYSDDLITSLLDEALKELARLEDVTIKSIKKDAKVSRFAEVVSGFYRGSAPSPADVAILKKKYGINKIISLDLEEGNKIKRACKLLGIKHVMLPISHDNFRTASGKFAKMDLNKLLLKDGPTFIHCLHGKDRTGFVVALFRIQNGESFKNAMSEAIRFNFGVGLKPAMRNKFIEVIRDVDKNTDTNEVNDIVMNQDLYGSVMNPVELPSFAPYTYNNSPQSLISEELYTRDNLDTGPIRNFPSDAFLDKGTEEASGKEKVRKAPQVGEVDSYTMLNGYGPVGGLGT